MTDGVAQVFVAHHHPGRVRLRSPAFDGRVLEAARSATAAIDGVRSVHPNADTRGLLVLYDPARTNVEEIIAAVARASGTTVGNGLPEPGHEDRLAYVAIDVVREVNDLVQDVTRHRTDLRVLVPATLAAAAGVAGVRRGFELPHWGNLLYWAYSVFMAVNERQIERSA